MRCKNKILDVNALIAIIMGIVFILSGVFKSVNVYSFADTISNFLYYFSLDFLAGISTLLAILLCAGEIVLGFMALHCWLSSPSGFAFFPVMFLFTIITGANYLLPNARIESCGCFGEVIHLSPLASFIKSIALLMLSIPLLRRAIADWRSGRRHTYCRFVHGNWSYYIILVSVPSLFLPLLSWFVVNELPHDLYIPIFIGASVLLMSLCFYSLWRLDEFVSLYKERK